MNDDNADQIDASARKISIAIVIIAITIIAASITARSWSSSLDATLRSSMRPAPASVEELYELRALSRRPAYALDAVTVTPDNRNFVAAAPGNVAAQVASGQSTTISGWAFDPANQNTSAGVVLEIDRTLIVPAQYGLDRSDVASAYHDAKLSNTGFTVNVAPGLLKPGRHCIELVVLSHDGSGYFKAARQVLLNQAG